MKHDFAFAAERTLARHSAALLRPGPADADVIEALRQATARLTRSLRGGLARLCGGEAPEIGIDPPRDQSLEDFAQGNLCAYSLYSVPSSGERLLSAIDADAVLRLVDRAFGGSGEAPRPPARELPMSAELMVQRIEMILAVELGEALGGAQAGRPDIQPLRRDTDLAQLRPFAAGARLAVLQITVSEGIRAPWHIRVALPMAAVPVLTGMVARPALVVRDPALADPLSEPFADMPIKLTALLVDTRLPLHVVSRLEPGQVLNLPIARQVPLIAGQGDSRRSTAPTVAVGTIGAMDDCVAIQITRLG